MAIDNQMIYQVLQSLAERHDQLTTEAERHTLPYRRPGRSRDEIERHARRQSAAIPDDIALLYSTIDGLDPTSQFFDGSPSQPGIHQDVEFPHLWLYPLAETYWAGAGGPDSPGSELVQELREHGSPQWALSGLYVFGQTAGGVSLCYCDAPPGTDPGTIVLAGDGFDILGAPDHPEVCVLGRSLAEWLLRWMGQDFVEFADVPGELEDSPEAVWRPCCESLLVLNPGLKWAEERLDAGNLPVCTHEPWWRHPCRQPDTLVLLILLLAAIFAPVLTFLFPPESPSGISLPVIYGILGVVVLLYLPAVTVQAMRIRQILATGSTVRGRCLKHGMRRAGMTDVTLEYTVRTDRFEIKLSVTDSRLPDPGSEVLLRLHPDKPNKFLLLQQTPVTGDAGLAHLEGLRHQKELFLKGLEITDAGMAQLKDLAQLEQLNLQNTKITDRGLAHLKGLTGLRQLNLNETGITDSGLEHLEELTQLRRLKLRDTEITDAGLAHLEGLTGLEELTLYGSRRVSAAGIARLEQALPDCTIAFDLRQAEAWQSWQAEQVKSASRSEDKLRKPEAT